MGDNIALIRFYRDWEADGVDAETGFPRYKPIVKISKSIPPSTEWSGRATEENFRDPDYREAYEQFRKEQKGIETSEEEGYPLVMWPAIQPSDCMACFAHEVYTVEQLARLPSQRTMALPAHVLELSKRAMRMVELAKKTGKYEAIINSLEAQIQALREDNAGMKATLDVQNMQLESFKMRMVA